MECLDASEIKFSQPTWQEHMGVSKETYKNTITLQLPVKKPKVTVPVVELFL